MENPAEEEVARRWRAQTEREEKKKTDADTSAVKRRRITNGNSGQQRGGDVEQVRQFMSNASRKQAKTPYEPADDDLNPDDLEDGGFPWSESWKSSIEEVQRG